MLLFMVGIGIISWQTMEGMNRRNVGGAIINRTATLLSDVESNMLRFMLWNDKKYHDDALGLLQQAENLVAEAIKTAVLPDVTAGIKKIENGVKESKQVIDTLTVAIEQQQRLSRTAASTATELENILREVTSLETQLYHQERDSNAHESYSAASELIRAFNRARQTVLLFMRTPTAELRQQAQAELVEVEKYWKDLAPHMERADEQALAQKATQTYKRYEDVIAAYFTQTDTRVQAQTTYRIRSQQLGKDAAALADLVQKYMTQGMETAKLQLVSGVLVAIFLGIGLALLFNRSIAKQLGADPAVLEALARRVSGGDYAIDDGKTHHGVFQEILHMVQVLKENIEKASHMAEEAQQQGEQARIAMEAAQKAQAAAENAKREGMLAAAGQLEGVVAGASSAAEELSAQIEQSSRGSQEQASRVAETATAVEEMNSTVLEVARNAGSAAEISAQTKAKAEHGATVVQDVVGAITTVQRDSTALKGDMGKLAEHAQNINQIMGVISDIADQTNLLALNAAIEAARAGEAGRGFAVVADEVRKLAEKTMASTTDVGNAIRAIQQSTADSTKQVDATVKNVEQATMLAGQCGEALREIVTLADSTADQVRAIATASEQQSASSEEIARSITQVNTIADETARAMEEAALAISELARQNQNLATLIDDMKRG